MSALILPLPESVIAAHHSAEAELWNTLDRHGPLSEPCRQLALLLFEGLVFDYLRREQVRRGFLVVTEAQAAEDRP